MSIHTLFKSRVINARMEECWDFFSNPRNLSKITPPSLDFRVLSDVPEHIYPGLMIRYRIRPLFGIPMNWLTEITNVREPFYFSDEQRVGPYGIWHHEHFFKELDDSLIEVRDLVHYALPFSVAGDMVHNIFVKRQIAKIFDYREQIVGAVFHDDTAHAASAEGGLERRPVAVSRGAAPSK